MNNVNNVKQIKDLTGQKFGRLVVIEQAESSRSLNGKNRIRWRCQCDCGNDTTVIGSNLISGSIKSCGCFRREHMSKKQFKNLIGQKFGRLTVLEFVKIDSGHAVWKCLCNCGNKLNVLSNNLRNGNTKSCGCLRHKDLQNQKFGRLTALESIGTDKWGGVIWKCLCECGKYTTVVGHYLTDGNTTSCGCWWRETHSGENHHNWKGGITSLASQIRHSIESKLWRKQVFERDSYTCQHCHQVGGNLIAHHLNLFSDIMKEHNITTLEEAIQCEALWSTNNGITLCIECHEREHQRLKAIAKTSNQFSI